MFFDWILAGLAGIAAGVSSYIYFRASETRVTIDRIITGGVGMGATVDSTVIINKYPVEDLPETFGGKAAAETEGSEEDARESFEDLKKEVEELKIKHLIAVRELGKAMEVFGSLGGRLTSVVRQIDSHQESDKKSKPDKHRTPDKHREGKVLVDLFVYGVPAIVTLAFVGTFLALEIMNNDDPNYQCSETFRASFLIIIGYYFGMGANTVASKAATVTVPEGD